MTQIVKSLSELKLNNDASVDLDTLLQNDHGRKLFAVFLKELNNSSDNILTLYLICCCFQNNQRIEDRQRLKQILEKTYNACFIKNQLPQLNGDLKQKLCESLQKTTYNETIFNAVKKELKFILDSDYYPKFLDSKIYQENKNFVLSAIQANSNKSASANGRTDELDDILVEQNNTDKSVKSSKNTTTSAKKETKSSSNFFAMPSIPLMKKTISNDGTNINIAATVAVSGVSSSRNLKHSKSSTSSSSASSIVSSSSLSKKSSRFNGFSRESSKSTKGSNDLSLGSGGGSTSSGVIVTKTKKLKQFPPNPYHVMTTAIPVSVQDSELQSVVSGDIQLEEFDNRCLKKMDNTRIEDVSYNNGPQNLSINSSNLKLNNSKQCKFNKQIKESINANKNANINLPPNAIIDFKIQQPNKECLENHKKAQMPISESDPQKFFEILSSKLNKYLEELNERPLRVKSFSNSHLPTFDTYENGEEHEYEEMNDESQEEVELEDEEMNRLNIEPVQFENKKIKGNFSLNCRHLLKNVDSDIDVQLEEHLDRVYNNGESDQAQLLKENHQRAHLKQQSHNDSSKMCVKVSSNSNGDKHKNRHNNEQQTNFHETSNKLPFKTSNNLSFNSYPSKPSHSNVYNKTNNNSNTQFDTNNHNQHHFYKLTSTSKEVDIDSQNYSLQNKSHSHIPKKYPNENLNDSSLSFNIKNLKNTSLNHHHHHSKTSNHNDSNSYDRVNDWLSSGFQQQQQQQEHQNTSQFKNESLNKNSKEPESNLKHVPENENVKTTVAYYLPGEDLAYISTYNGKYLTLAQFKQLITKKGNFRYFFKTTSDLLGDECVVYQEANDENSNVPMFNNKVIAKIEKIIN